MDAGGKLHREKVGPKGLALRVYQKRKTQIRERTFFPELLSHAKGPTFAEAIDDYLKRKEPVWRAWKEWKRIGEKWKERFNVRYLRSIDAATSIRKSPRSRANSNPGQ